MHSENQANNLLSISVRIEDYHSDDSELQWQVSKDDTVSTLKNKLQSQHGVPYELQHWIIGDEILQGDKSMSDLALEDGAVVYVYLSSPRRCILSAESKKLLREFLDIPDNDNDNDCDASLLSIEDRLKAASTSSTSSIEEIAVKTTNCGPGWACSDCTFLNTPMRPGCEICANARPEEYVVPKNYLPSVEEKEIVDREEAARLSHFLEQEENFEHYANTDTGAFVVNKMSFECPICFDDIEPGDGIILRDCLHEICQECMRGCIENCDQARVACPFQDDDYQCASYLQEREIKSLVTDKCYRQIQDKGLQLAEAQIKNSFHCLTVDCRGWCVVEDDANFFTCNLCKRTSCLTCNVIHEGMNCQEYQSDLKLRAANDKAAKEAQDAIDKLLGDGDAMRCPGCKVVIQKKLGCDFVQCSICQHAICWATRQSRWGPKGAGDTSGGCRCGVNGMCHPKCQGCH